MNLELNNRKQYQSEFILLFCSLVWGFSFPSVKIALNYISPNAFIFFRFAFTIILFIIIFQKKIRSADKKSIKYGFILGAFLFVGFVTQTIGLKHTTASNSAFITGTNLILIPFVQLIVIKTKPKSENIIGIIIVVAGLFFLTEIKNAKFNFGDFITLFCAVAFAFHIVFLDLFSKKGETISLIYGQYISMTLLSFIYLIFYEIPFSGSFKFVHSEFLYFSIIFNGLFSTFIALFLAMKYQKFTTPVRAGLIYNMEQVFAVFFSYLLLSEILSSNQIVGAVFMILGLAYSEFYAEIRNKFNAK